MVKLSEPQRRVLRILASTEFARLREGHYNSRWTLTNENGMVGTVGQSTVNVLASAGYITMTGNGYRITEEGRAALTTTS